VVSADILVHVKGMHPSRLILLLLAACINTGCEARVLQCNGLHCPKKCLVGIQNDGPIKQHDVQFMLGIDLTACNDPIALANVQNFAQQILCLGLGHQPLAGVAVGNELVTVSDLNQKFKCSNQTLQFEANTIQQVVDFLNNVLEVPTCFEVPPIHICGFGSRKEVGWATVQLQVCTEDGKHIHVFRPYTTLHGVQVNLIENTRLSEISDVLMPLDYHNAFVFVPKALLRRFVDLFKWRIAKDAASGQDDLSKLRELWKNLCLDDKSHRDVFRCDEITNQMMAICEQYRSNEDKRKLQKLDACVKEMYPDNTMQQEEIMHNENLKMCNLLQGSWTTPTQLHPCMQKQDTGVLERCVEFMTTVKDTVLFFVGMSFDAICYVESWIDWLCGKGWKLILIAYGWREIGMFSSFWALMITLYKFSGKVEKAAPCSKSSWDTMKLYFLGLFLIPWTFCRKVKHKHKEIIDKNLSKRTEAQLERLLAQRNMPTTESMFSFVKQTIAQNHEEIIDQNLSKITEAQFERLLAQQKIPTTEAMFSFIQKTIAQESEVTRQTFQNVRKDLRFIQNALEEHDSMLEEEDSDRALEQKLASEVVPTIQESVQAGDGERWRRLLADDRNG
jgi:hypothetical protein